MIKQLFIIEDLRKIKSIEDIVQFEKIFNVEIPDFFSEFLLNYEGSKIQENIYFSEEDKEWFSINQVLYLNKNANAISIADIFEIKALNKFEWLPFANDSGGWLFMISLKAESQYQVWIHEHNGSIKKIANSFIYFINNLVSYEQAALLGY